MYISKLSLVNYRNFSNAKLMFSKGINTVIGENGAGKTNLFRAIRLLLDNSMRRSATRLEERDFYRGLGDWRGHWIIISIEFGEISADEEVQSLFLHGVGNVDEEPVKKATINLIFRPKALVRNELNSLEEGDLDALSGVLSKVTIDDYETIITGKSTADFNDPEVYKEIVGDFRLVKFPSVKNDPVIGGVVPSIFSISNEVSFAYIQALRDVVSDFQNRRTNPLFALLKSKSGEIDEGKFDPIVQQVDALNESIESLDDVVDVKKDIGRTINDAVGDAYSPSSLSIKSELPNEAEKLFQSLKLFVAEPYDDCEGAIHEMSLGGANLIYLALKLLEFKYQKENQSIANFLLIEEPEAHIHTHIQKSLFDKLDYDDTQVIYSTHSSHISESSRIDRVNVLGRVEGKVEAFQPANGLEPSQVRSVERYLDAVRSNLLFAKSVVLVEGDAEEILIPVLIKKLLGVSLDELGVSLVNIRSTGFENVALLFDDERIRKKCSIVTDLDDTFFNTDVGEDDSSSEKSIKKKAEGSKKSGQERKERLEKFCSSNSWVKSFYAPHTFEVDFIESGNSDYVVEVVEDVYKQDATIKKAKEELSSGDIELQGKRILTMANGAGKGWLAILLSKRIDHNVVVPDYILDAVFFAHGDFDDGVLLKIYRYRLFMIAKKVGSDEKYAVENYSPKDERFSQWEKLIGEKKAKVKNVIKVMNDFSAGETTIQKVMEEFESNFSGDLINSVFESLS